MVILNAKTMPYREAQRERALTRKYRNKLMHGIDSSAKSLTFHDRKIVNRDKCNLVDPSKSSRRFRFDE